MFRITYLHREEEYKPVLTYHLPYGLDKAADHANKITNSSKKDLTEPDLKILSNFSGPNLSDGDIVEVIDLRRSQYNRYYKRYKNEWKTVEKPVIST